MMEWQETEIGTIPSDWHLVRLEELGEKKKRSFISGPFGSNISSKFFVEYGIPVIRGNNLTIGKERFVDKDFVFLTKEKADELNTYAQSNDIILTAAGTIGQVGIIGEKQKFEKYIISNKQLRARLNIKKAHPLFVYFWLSSNRMTKQIISRNTGSTIPLINLTVLKDLPVPLPSPTEQRRIVKAIDTIDRKINNLQNQNETLEKIVQTLFKQWFVDFNFPDENGNHYKDNGGEMVASELGKIPTGWKVEGFLESFTLMSGGTPKTSVPDYWNGNIKWISAKDITANHKKFILDTEKKVTDDGINKSATKLLPKYSIVISARGTVGKYCILPEEMCISQSNYGIAAKRGNIHFYTYLLVAHIIKQLKAQAYGSVFDTITTRIFKSLQIVMPAETTLDLFIKVIESFFKKIQLNSEEIQTLTQTRDTLLPKLMSGHIRIKD